MAIVTTKAPSQTEWLFSGNNHILEFESDDENTTPQTATISIQGIDLPILIYPDPEGKFWFNFQEYFEVLFDNMIDDIDPETVNEIDFDTYLFDWTKSVKTITVEYSILMTDETSVTSQITLFVAFGVEDYLSYKQGENKSANKVLIQLPLKIGTSTNYYAKYFEGYPFDIGFTQAIPALINPQNIQNLVTGEISADLNTSYSAQRLVFSNGDETTTIENHLVLIEGTNIIRFAGGTGPDQDVYIKKVETCEGVYLKWLNSFGGYSYYLFNDRKTVTLDNNSKGMALADHKELQDTNSPWMGLGKERSEEWDLIAEYLTKDDVNLLFDLLESRQVYLFTGRQYSANSTNDWLQVEVLNKSIIKENFKGKVPQLPLKIRLPRTKQIHR